MDAARKSRAMPTTARKPNTAILFVFPSGDLAEILSKDRRSVLRARLERDDKAAQQEAAAPSPEKGERRRSVPPWMSPCQV